MKYVVAIVQPHTLQLVKQELIDEGVYNMTISSVLGCGEQEGYTETYRGVRREVNLLKHVKFEIAVNDDWVERTVQAIVRGAQTGSLGDGKIFVYELPQCVRIRDNERGPKAI